MTRTGNSICCTRDQEGCHVYPAFCVLWSDVIQRSMDLASFTKHTKHHPTVTQLLTKLWTHVAHDLLEIFPIWRWMTAMIRTWSQVYWARLVGKQECFFYFIIVSAFKDYHFSWPLILTKQNYSYNQFPQSTVLKVGARAELISLKPCHGHFGAFSITNGSVGLFHGVVSAHHDYSECNWLQINLV